MAQAAPFSASHQPLQDKIACSKEVEENLHFPRLLVLYAVTNLTGTTLKIVQKLGIDKLLQTVTPALRAAAALLVCKPAIAPGDAQDRKASSQVAIVDCRCDKPRPPKSWKACSGG